MNDHQQLDLTMVFVGDQGAEYDVMPCLAEFKEAELIDDPLLIEGLQD